MFFPSWISDLLQPRPIWSGASQAPEQTKEGFELRRLFHHDCDEIDELKTRPSLRVPKELLLAVPLELHKAIGHEKPAEHGPMLCGPVPLQNAHEPARAPFQVLK